MAMVYLIVNVAGPISSMTRQIIDMVRQIINIATLVGPMVCLSNQQQSWSNLNHQHGSFYIITTACSDIAMDGPIISMAFV